MPDNIGTIAFICAIWLVSQPFVGIILMETVLHMQNTKWDNWFTQFLIALGIAYCTPFMIMCITVDMVRKYVGPYHRIEEEDNEGKDDEDGDEDGDESEEG